MAPHQKAVQAATTHTDTAAHHLTQVNTHLDTAWDNPDHIRDAHQALRDLVDAAQAASSELQAA
ncbi:hypothetical protein [Nocardiopsis sp. LOL_012]|uniref:hypothetical protein n=1 Tax=Nocardiopsis sp. LOL_012 TaxID=3345409 RepID=UPI003A8AE842